MANNLSQNLKTYVIPIVSIVVVIFLVPGVILPQIKKIQENYRVVTKDDDRLDKLEAKADALEELSKSQDSLDKNLAIAESALPIQKDVARLIRGVQNLAQASGLEVSKVEIKPGKTATDSATPQETTQASTETTAAQTPKTVTNTSKTELIFGLTLKGNLNSFQSFLKSIEGTKRLLILSSFKSTSTTGTDFTFTVLINAPFGPLPKIASDQLAKAVAELSANNQKLLKDLESSAFRDVTNESLPTGPTGVTDPFK